PARPPERLPADVAKRRHGPQRKKNDVRALEQIVSDVAAVDAPPKALDLAVAVPELLRQLLDLAPRRRQLRGELGPRVLLHRRLAARLVVHRRRRMLERLDASREGDARRLRLDESRSRALRGGMLVRQA